MATAVPQVRVGVGVFILKSPSPTSISSATNSTFLIGRRLGSHGANTYALPGGHLEFSETPEACASREILEETGLHIKNLRFLTATNDYMEEEGKHYVTLFMVCERVDEGQEAEVLETGKCAGWEWIQWEDMVETVRVMKQGGGEKRLFLPLVNLVEQRPGVMPTL